MTAAPTSANLRMNSNCLKLPGNRHLVAMPQQDTVYPQDRSALQEPLINKCIVTARKDQAEHVGGRCRSPIYVLFA